MVLVADFIDSADIGAKGTVMQLRKRLRQLTMLRVTGQEIVAGQRRQQRGGIDQRPFRCTPYAGFNLLHKDRENKPRGNGDNQEIAQQQTHANAHQRLLRL